ELFDRKRRETRRRPALPSGRRTKFHSVPAALRKSSVGIPEFRHVMRRPPDRSIVCPNRDRFLERRDCRRVVLLALIYLTAPIPRPALPYLWRAFRVPQCLIDNPVGAGAISLQREQNRDRPLGSDYLRLCQIVIRVPL